MRCDECREAISARLDSEDLPGESALIDAHLSTCAACRVFEDDAARVTRLARTRVVGVDTDLLPAILGALDAGDTAPDDPRGRPGKAPAPRRAVNAVRAGLAALAVGQLGLAVSGIVAATDDSHFEMVLSGASATHFSHESAAWNLALGVAFGWVAMRGRRVAPALVPVIGAFVAVLAVLSLADLIAGSVDVTRLLGHGPVAAGLLLLMTHHVLPRGGGDGSRDTAAPAAHRPPDGPAGPGTPLRRRFSGDDEGLEPTGRHAA